MIISTVPDVSAEKDLLHFIHRRGGRAKMILRASNSAQAQELYENGAAFVIVPELLAGEWAYGEIQKIIGKKTMRKKRR